MTALFEVSATDVADTNDDWYTPSWLFDAAGLMFDLDVAAPVNPARRTCPAKAYLTPVEDGLEQEWSGVVWCNPPYSGPAPRESHRSLTLPPRARRPRLRPSWRTSPRSSASGPPAPSCSSSCPRTISNPHHPAQGGTMSLSLPGRLAVIEQKVKAELGHLDDEAKADLSKLLAAARTDAAELEQQVRDDIKAQAVPLLTQLKAGITQALEAAGPGVQSEVTGVVEKLVAGLAKVLGTAL